jgi:hypothetical protein
MAEARLARIKDSFDLLTLGAVAALPHSELLADFTWPVKPAYGAEADPRAARHGRRGSRHERPPTKSRSPSKSHASYASHAARPDATQPRRGHGGADRALHAPTHDAAIASPRGGGHGRRASAGIEREGVSYGAMSALRSLDAPSGPAEDGMYVGGSALGGVRGDGLRELGRTAHEGGKGAMLRDWDQLSHANHSVLLVPSSVAAPPFHASSFHRASGKPVPIWLQHSPSDPPSPSPPQSHADATAVTADSRRMGVNESVNGAQQRGVNGAPPRGVNGPKKLPSWLEPPGVRSPLLPSPKSPSGQGEGGAGQGFKGPLATSPLRGAAGQSFAGDGGQPVYRGAARSRPFPAAAASASGTRPRETAVSAPVLAEVSAALSAAVAVPGRANAAATGARAQGATVLAAATAAVPAGVPEAIPVGAPAAVTIQGGANAWDDLPTAAAVAPSADEEVVALEFQPCPHCSRAFEKGRLGRHVDVCQRSRAPPAHLVRGGVATQPNLLHGGGRRCDTVEAVGSETEPSVPNASVGVLIRAATEPRRVGRREGKGNAPPPHPGVSDGSGCGSQGDSVGTGSGVFGVESSSGGSPSTSLSRTTFASLTERSERAADRRITCPHCSRKFHEQAAERHIPHCGDVRARLPRGPKAEKGTGAAAAAAAERAAGEAAAAALLRARGGRGGVAVAEPLGQPVLAGSNSELVADGEATGTAVQQAQEPMLQPGDAEEEDKQASGGASARERG